MRLARRRASRRSSTSRGRAPTLAVSIRLILAAEKSSSWAAASSKVRPARSRSSRSSCPRRRRRTVGLCSCRHGTSPSGSKMHLAECNIIGASCYQQATRRKGERAHTNRGLPRGGPYGSQDDAPIESVLCSKALLSPLPTATGSKCLSADSSSLRSEPQGSNCPLRGLEHQRGSGSARCSRVWTTDRFPLQELRIMAVLNVSLKRAGLASTNFGRSESLVRTSRSQLPGT